MTAIKVKNTKQPILFISLYIPPDTQLAEIKESLQKLFNYIDNSTIPVFLGGDLNAHHSTWDCVPNKTDRRGELISEIIGNSNTIFLNTEVGTRWEDINNNSSAIDLTITTPELGPITSWETSSEDLGSDHKLIECQITQYNKYSNKTSKTIISKNKAIENINQLDPKSITNIEQLNKEIEKALNKASYTIHPNSKKKIKPHWNENIKKLYEIKNRKHIEFRNNLTLANKHEFKKAERNFRNALKKEVFEYRNKMLDELNERTSVNEMWSIVRCVSGNYKHKENAEIINNKELATKFIELNFKEETHNNLSNTSTNYGVEEEKYVASFKIENMIKTIKERKDTSAAGLNKLSY